MKWFKHYSNSLHSDSLSQLLIDCGLEGYARYWILLEELAERFDGQTTSFRIQSATIRSLFRIRSWNELDSFAVRLSNIRGMNIKRNENVFEIEAPILLELLGKDFRVARQARANTAPKIENKIKNKIENNINNNNICSEQKNLVPNQQIKNDLVVVKITGDKEIGISKELINSWSDTFPKEFLEIEFKKARSWLITNSHRSPKKNYGRFFNNWFNRGWEQYRKTLSSNPVKITVEDLQDSIERWSL